MEYNDNELVKQIKYGDQSAFKVLYLKYADLLFAYILHHTDNEAASEIWQQTWVVFVEKIRNVYDQDEYLETVIPVSPE